MVPLFINFPSRSTIRMHIETYQIKLNEIFKLNSFKILKVFKSFILGYNCNIIDICKIQIIFFDIQPSY